MPVCGAAPSWLPTPFVHGLLSREYEDGTVCFIPETGETLLLSHLASFLLTCWRPDAIHPLTPAELLAEVLAVEESPMDTDVAEALVDQALTELHRAGFVTLAD